MTDTEIAEIAHGIGNMLLSHAAHGMATSSLHGMGEITLRDALVVAVAAAGSRQRQAWVIDREMIPNSWVDAPVDLIISKLGHSGNLSLVGGAELKWWRRADAGNAANRRRDLLKDFFRAAALYHQVSDFSFVALLPTPEAWKATTRTHGTDQAAMELLRKRGSQRWNTSKLKSSAAMRGAMQLLRVHVPVWNVFHSELLCSARLTMAHEPTIISKVWRVKKPQNTNFMADAQIAQLGRLLIRAPSLSEDPPAWQRSVSAECHVW
jgi:hypothetical protein